MNALRDLKLTRVANAAAAGITEVDTSILDMAGFEGVMFVCLLNTVTAGSVVTVTAQQNTANQTGGMAPIANASASVTDVGGASSNQAIVLDVFRPLQEFVRAAVTRTTANAALDGVIAIQYAAHRKPTVQDASVIASVFAIGS